MSQFSFATVFFVITVSVAAICFSGNASGQDNPVTDAPTLTDTGQSSGAAEFKLLYLAILDSIDLGDYAAALTQTRRMPQQSDSFGIPWHLCDIAAHFEAKGRLDEATTSLQLLVDNYPTSEFTPNAKLKASYFRALTGIKTEQYDTAVQQGELMASAYAAYPATEWHLCDIAAKLAANYKQAEAAKLFELLSNTFPQSDFVKLRASHFKVLSLIQTGQYDLAMTQTQALVSQCRNNPDIPWHVADIEYRFENYDRLAEAQKTYELMLADPKTFAAYAGIAERGKKRLEAIQQIQARGADSIAVSASLNQIKQGFGGDANAAYAAFFVGEKMYTQSQKNSDANQKKSLLDGAETMFDYCAGKFTDKTAMADNQYMLGLTCMAMDNYYKAAQAFQSAYDANPNHTYADYCLLTAGRCYEKLSAQKVVSEKDAKSIIAAQYSQLKSKFPQSQYVSYVQTWLENNSK